jgi:hypothetical protein
MAMLNTQHRVLLLASLIGSSLLTGCANSPSWKSSWSGPFEEFYKPAATAYGSRAAAPATPLLVLSRELDGVAKVLARKGYVLIGTSSFDGLIDDTSSRHLAVIQGKNVGAAVVLLKVETREWLPACADCSWRKKSNVFAWYWAKANAS